MYFNTSLLHGKNTAQYADGATLVPVFQSNAFCCQTMEDLERVFSHKKSGFAYSRIGNPTVAAFEQRISELEGGIGAVATSSGMAAVSHTLLSLLVPGDEIIASGCLYGGTIGLFDDLERLGIHTHFVSRLDEESIRAAVSSRTRCVFGEVIANPALNVLNIREAARAACLDETIEGFTKGYDTFVGERGVTLSGGQKQRTAIARTLTSEAPILIFDDSLSAVDTQTDAKIRAAIAERFGKASVILISHRITTLSAAHKILVLDRGRVVEEGTHEDLKEAGGIYQKIYETQTGLREEVE